MKYIFTDGNLVGEYPVERIQHCWYDGTVRRDGCCFDERFIDPKDFDYLDLSYIETEEERRKQGIDHSRMFVTMKNGERYELILRKVGSGEDLSRFVPD